MSWLEREVEELQKVVNKQREEINSLTDLAR